MTEAEKDLYVDTGIPRCPLCHMPMNGEAESHLPSCQLRALQESHTNSLVAAAVEACGSVLIWILVCLIVFSAVIEVSFVARPKKTDFSHMGTESIVVPDSSMQNETFFSPFSEWVVLDGNKFRFWNSDAVRNRPEIFPQCFFSLARGVLLIICFFMCGHALLLLNSRHNCIAACGAILLVVGAVVLFHFILAFVDLIEISVTQKYLQIVKTYVHEDAQNAERKYSAPEFVIEEKKAVAGFPDMRMASTSHIERLNGTTRLHMRRLTRLTYAFSKKRENFEAAVALHFAYYNFVKRHNTLRCTPAMAAGIERNFWTVGDLLEAAA